MTTERKKEVAPQKVPAAAMTSKKASWPIVTIGIFATIIGLAIIAVAWIMIVIASSYATNSQNTRDGGWIMQEDSGDDSMGSDDRDMIRGVVTEIDGDFLTVRGDGREVTVLATDDVSVSGSKSTVAVNDTVVMYGTEYDDGTFEAEHIVIRNNCGASDSDGYERRQPMSDNRRQLLPSA